MAATTTQLLEPKSLRC